MADLPTPANSPAPAMPDVSAEPRGEASLIAYEIHEPWDMPIVPAPINRDWMDRAHQRHPYRCLPLVIANQSGWMMLSPCAFRCFWYGGERAEDLEVHFDSTKDPRITSHFGNGVLTFSMPYLFRTPPGCNLWVKGPANWIKDAIQPLEGVVETDWVASTFTMNWKVTRTHHWISFERGEPFCMLVPLPRGLIETLMPQQIPLDTNPELHAAYKRWEAGRSKFLDGLSKLDAEVVKQGWQKEYFQGRTAEGGRFQQHQTHLTVREFEKKTKPST